MPCPWHRPADLMTLAVRPAALEPLPEVYTAMGAVCDANFRNWDLAVEGSPSSSTLMSPRRCVPSGMRLRAPPNSSAAIAFLISACPKICGVRDGACAGGSKGALPSDAAPAARVLSHPQPFRPRVSQAFRRPPAQHKPGALLPRRGRGPQETSRTLGAMRSKMRSMAPGCEANSLNSCSSSRLWVGCRVGVGRGRGVHGWPGSTPAAGRRPPRPASSRLSGCPGPCSPLPPRRLPWHTPKPHAGGAHENVGRRAVSPFMTSSWNPTMRR